MTAYCVYHIHRPGQGVDEGYIGITNDPERRMKQHRKSKYIVGNALRKYDDIIMTILFWGSESDCLELEEELRPQETIGWNIAVGGRKPPTSASFKGRKHSDETKTLIAEKGSGKKNHRANPVNIYDYKTNDLIAENVCMSEWLRDNNLTNRHLSCTARGKRKHSKGLYARYV